MLKNEKRPGYKKTNVGWIPDEWECVPFATIFDLTMVSLEPTPSIKYREIGVRSHGKGIFHKPPVTGESLGDKRVFHCQPGTLVFNIVFAWEQAVAVLSESERGFIASHRFPMFQGRKHQASEAYYLLFFKTRRGKEQLTIASPGGAGRNKTLGQSDLEVLPIPCPPFPEQIAIAEVLECWDKAIRTLQQKLANIIQLKKWLLQKLFSGSIRLKGFSKPWKSVRLKTVLKENPHYGINAPAVPFSTELPAYLRITDISDAGRLIKEGRTSVDHPDADNYVLNHNDIVFVRTGASTGKAFLYTSDQGKLVYAGFLIRISTDRNRLEPAFLKHFTETHEYLDWVSVMSTRSGQPGINGQEYAQLMIPLPSLEEQRAIAELLTSEDMEIQTLERKLALLIDQKKYLLNNLVTGTIRLPAFAGKY